MARRSALLTTTLAAAGLMALGPTGVASAETEVAQPDSFTSMFTAMATPDMVINNDGVPTPGTAGATGMFTYRINSDLEIICYDITVRGITGPFMSPAKTATHIHEGAPGAAGPPRIAFPNPADQGDGSFVSSGCLQGPFTTGVMAPDGSGDTGDGFTLTEIEANPSAFFTDTHTAANPAGAVRGQLVQMPLGGVDTGAGGLAQDDPGTGGSGLLPIGALAVAATAVGAVLVRRREHSAPAAQNSW